MRAHILPVLAMTMLIGWGCTAPPPARQPEPGPDACSDSLYLELSGQHPDSLSERAWARLQQLDDACRAGPARSGEADTLGSGPAHYWGMWLWMPTMMVTGALMWLMMGAGT